MVTKYDVFEFMYTCGRALQPKEITTAFASASVGYKFIYRLITELLNLNFVVKNAHGYEAIPSKKNDTLYQMIKYCLSNGINHNELLDAKITEFIAQGIAKEKFTLHDFDYHPKTYSKYVNILQKNGLLILVSRKPLTGIIPYNTFLKDLVTYFNQTIPPLRIKKNDYSSQIELELKTFQKLRRKNFALYQRITNEFELRFIHHSLSLEGNPITLPDTIKLLQEHVVPTNVGLESIQEVKNYQRAMKKMLDDAFNKHPLTKKDIIHYHSMTMQHRHEIGGKIRTLSVHIKGNPAFEVAAVSEIETKLNSLMTEYNTFMTRKHPLKEVLRFSSYFHNEFQHIHPFEDGNSRTTRLITFHFLRTQDIPILDIPLGLLEQYLLATKGSKKREDDQLSKTLQLILLYNLKTVNERLR